MVSGKTSNLARGVGVGKAKMAVLRGGGKISGCLATRVGVA